MKLIKLTNALNDTDLIKTEMIINSLNVINVEYQKIDDDMYMMSFVYTED